MTHLESMRPPETSSCQMEVDLRMQLPQALQKNKPPMIKPDLYSNCSYYHILKTHPPQVFNHQSPGKSTTAMPLQN